MKTTTTPSKRLPALDFWRGAYLLMIYVNHVPDNPLSFLTLRHWGFADSAEAFIFISGFSAMLAFGPYFERGGFGVGLLRILKRAWQLFCAHVLLVFGLSAMIALAGDFVDNREIMEQLNFSPFFVETDVAIVKLLRLSYMPNMMDILPLYIVLVLLFPLAWALVRASSLLALGVSFGFWLWANLAGLSVPNYPEGAVWFFNPVAWQFLFVSGMVAYRERERLLVFIQKRTVLWLAIVLAGLGAMAAAPWTSFESFSSYRIVPQTWLAVDNKMNLSWVRVVHFFALAVIGARLVVGRTAFWKRLVVKALSSCGRHALAIFCVGTGLSLFMHILLLMGAAKGQLAAMLLVFTGALTLILLSLALDRAKSLLAATRVS